MGNYNHHPYQPEEDLLLNRDDILLSQEKYLDLIHSEILKATVARDYDFLEMYLQRIKELNSDDVSQHSLTCFWLSLYFRDREMANFLRQNFEYLQNKFKIFNDLNELDNVFEDLNDSGRIINDGVLRHLIRLKEETLAIIVVQYDCMLSEESLYYIIKYDMRKLLKQILIQKKNYFMDKFNFWKNIEKQDPLVDIEQFMNNEYTNITMEIVAIKYVILKSIEINPEKTKELLEEIISWRIPTRENILTALLENNLDSIAIKHFDLIQEFVTDSLIIFSIKNQNEEFLKFILLSSHVTINYLEDDTLVDYVINLLTEGETLIFGLKLLKIMEPQKLNINHNKKILNNLTDQFNLEDDKRSIFFCENVIFAIALASEIILDICTKYKTFEIKCFNLTNQMVRFGEIFINEIDDQEYFEKIMYQVDFKNRSTIDIITSNKLENLLSDEKVELIFSQLWNGPYFMEYENGMDNISICHHSTWSKIDIEGNPLTYLFYSLQPKKQINFILQNKYRRVASNFYFLYEFLFTFLMLILLQIINLKFISKGYLENERNSIFNTSQINFIQFLNGTNLTTTILRLIFNTKSDRVLQWDAWMIYDFITSLLNFINLQFIGYYVYNNFDYPDSVLYFNVVVVVLNWVRFFMLFLCIVDTSYLITSLVEMIKAIMNFLILLVSYLIIITTFMYIVFSPYIPDVFSSFFMTMGYLFDAMMGQINHPTFTSEADRYEYIHRIVLALHVICSNVILLSYLIAILSQVFEEKTNSLEKRIFSYRSSINQYIKRYSPGMNDLVYGNLILIQPPFNVLCGIFLIFDFFKYKVNESVAFIEFCNFWLVNIILALMYSFYLFFSIMIIYFKKMLVISNLKISKIWVIYYFIIWFFTGPFILFGLAFNDLVNFLYVLSFNYERKEIENKGLTDKDRKLYYGIYQEIKRIIEEIYSQINKEIIFDNITSLVISKDVLIKYIIVNKVDDKIFDYFHNGNQKKKLKLFNSILLKKMMIKKASKKLKAFNNLDYIFEKFEKIQPDSKHPEIMKMIEIFLNSFIHLENNKEMIEIEMFRKFLKQKITYHNIDKFLMVNIKHMKSTVKEIKNSDFFGIKDFFDKINIERYNKLTKMMKSIKSHLNEVLKSFGVFNFKETYLHEKQSKKNILEIKEQKKNYSIIAIIKEKMREIILRDGGEDIEVNKFKAKKNIDYKELSNKIKDSLVKTKQILNINKLEEEIKEN